MTHRAGRLWIITGASGVGKTRFCSNLAMFAKQQELFVKGLICPAVFHDGRKKSIQVIDLETGEKANLAKARNASSDGSVTDRWDFDEAVMLWSNRRLTSLRNCDLAIIDELATLEFNLGQGWQQGLEFLDTGDFENAVVVIRPDLVKTAQNRWPKVKVIEIPAMLNAVEEKGIQQKILNEILNKTP
jgi:nucleoside-triphosphatase THEP1